MSGFTRPTALAPGEGIEGFRCGDAVVDAWAEKHSSSARKRGSAIVYAVYCDGAAAGFYTLSTHSVAGAEVSGGWFARNAPEQVSAVLLGMLGVDERFKGQGLGASLLRDAVQNAMKVVALAGARALVVDPTGERAASFYEHFGFTRLPGTTRMALKLM